MAASQRTTVVLDPDDRPEHAKFLHSLGDVPEGRVVCEFLPGRRTLFRLAHTLLAGLGKDVGLTGAGRNAEEEWRRVEAWVAGERPEVLVVWRAQHLPRSHWEKLMALPLEEDARLYLVVQGTATSRGQREAICDHGLEQIPFEELRSRFADVALKDPPQTGHSTDFPAVPPDEFPAFLAACRSVVDSERFARVEERYWAAYDAAVELVKKKGYLPALERALGPFVRELLRDARTLDEILVALRAAQAAFFLHGYLMGVDRDSLAAGYAATPRAPLDEATAGRLRRLGHPRLAALGVIALAATPDPTVLSSIDMGDVSSDGDSVRVGEDRIEISPAARGIVRAHLAHRLEQGAAEGDPLFVSETSQAWERPGFHRTTPHGIQQRLRQVALETGVPVASSEGWLRSDKRWLGRRGITVRELGVAA